MLETKFFLKIEPKLKENYLFFRTNIEDFQLRDADNFVILKRIEIKRK
jgi:hypothetical protein